jgi:hypothetical protein
MNMQSSVVSQKFIEWFHAPVRHYRESGNPVLVVFPGFRLALAIASLAGMTEQFPI